jgi:serine/threonine protein kinase
LPTLLSGHSGLPTKAAEARRVFLERQAPLLQNPPSSSLRKTILSGSEQRIGDSIAGRYRLLSVLGMGGAGVLYCARDENTGDLVALKLLRHDVVAAIAAPARWQREAAVARALQHPNVVRVLDSGECEGLQFVAMELLQGHTLQDQLARHGPMPVSETLEIILPIIGALAVAHDRGILHRDLKPANIFLAQVEGKRIPKLLDFGIAKHSDDAGITHVDQVLGTPGFMSPEQARGAELDATSDLWALAAVIYVCLTGRLPFAPSAVRSGPAPLLATSALSHAALLVPVIERALEWNPAARAPNARAFAHALLLASQVAGYALPDDPEPHGLPAWPTWLSELDGRAPPTVTLSAGMLSTSSQLAFAHGLEQPNTPDSRAALPEVGSKLVGRFRLLRLLGAGAMGSVFHAIDYAPGGGPVALKLLHRLDATGVFRLKQEFRALSDVTHPNLVALHELFADSSGRWFFTMELLAARHFNHYVRSGDGPALVADKLRLLLPQLADGLRHLHGLGRIHRDLKPSNVLVTSEGRLVIVDFGLTEARVGADQVHMEPGFLGTPAYAAPEQVEAARTLPASDWYAVGVMLYEVLTGRLPFEGTGDAILLAKSRTPPAHPSLVGAADLPADLSRLCMQLLERDPAQRASGRDVLALGPGAQPDRLQETAQPPFVGRGAEIAQLSAAFERVCGGEQVVVLVAGESGIGKTTLVERFLAGIDVEKRARLLAGRCYAYEALPYKAFDGVVDALTSQLRELPSAQLREILPRDVAVLAQLFPVLRRIEDIAVMQAPALIDERGLRQRAFAALKQLLASLAEQRPLVIFVDDLQWGDLDSARLLRELLSEPRRPALLFIGTHRDRDDGASSPLLAELFDLHGAFRASQRIALGPLSDTSIETLAKQLLGETHGAISSDEIAKKSQGHPMLASELARFALDRGNAALPDDVSLEKALAARMAKLAPECRAVLELLAVAGRRLPRELVFMATPTADLAALRQLRLARATRESFLDGTLHLEPYHDRVGELVLSQLSDAERRARHGMLAEQTLELGDAYVDLTVDSYVGAGRLHEAGMLAERAAARAHAALGFHRAADLLEMALAQADDASEAQRLRIALGDACVRAGRAGRAAEHYDRAALSALGEEQFELRRQAMMQYLVSGHATRGRELLNTLEREVGLPLVKAEVPSVAFLLLHAALSFVGWPALRSPPAAKSARNERDRIRLRVIWSVAPPLIHLENRMAVNYVFQALHLAARCGETSIYAQALCIYWCGILAFWCRPSALIERHCARALALIESSGDRWQVAFVRASMAGAAGLLFDMQRALDLSLDIATSQDARSALGTSVQTFARSVALPALYWQGRVTQLSELAERWIVEAHDSGDLHLEFAFRFVAAHRHLRRDDPAAANADLAQAEGLGLEYVHPSSYDPWWQSSVLMYEGRAQEVLALSERNRSEFAARSRYYPLHGVVWWLIIGTAHAELAARGIDRRASLRALARAARNVRFSWCAGVRPIRAQLDGTLAWLRGDRPRAFAWLERAIDAYDAQGFRLHAASLRLRLAALQHPAAETLERRALAVFAEESIQAPARWAAMLAPGLQPI